VLVANLPYNVSVPVLLHFLERFPGIERGLVMVQAEVGERVAASPGSKVYGAPSVKAAWYGEFSTAGKVSRQVFWPVPNVDSILVRFERRAQPGTEAERLATFELVDAAFQQRRKMLRQALSSVLGDSSAASARLEAAGIAPTARGEELTVADFLAIVRTADSMSDRAVLDATGRHPDEWFAFLDAQGATAWTGERIAEWLHDEAPGVAASWREVIAARYWQARGIAE
jgi:16S rRNA (adenine1518-N6/adenine1519-N6)-dimethyltransferase